MHFSACATSGGSDTEWKHDAPAFGSCSHRIAKFEKGNLDEDESEQMDNRVTYLMFTHEFTKGSAERRECKPCKACGAKLYLEGREQRGSSTGGGSSSAQGGGPAPNTGPSSSSTEVSGGSSSSAGGVVRATITEQLAQLEDLRSRGVLDDEEFKLGKRAILNPS